ncbi:MAG: hypothetical protein DLM67_25240 [Candidatus Nephthysia bennettiae]|nr:MAG: hypothetical protein DLM67_25240 [Candidatus Dormibacteraeota bacterium]
MIERTSDPGLIAQTVALHLAGLAGVARLTAGAGAEAATYYAGGKTLGVVVRQDLVRLHIVVLELPLVGVAERVRETVQRALRALGAERPVEVVVEDVELDQLPLSLPPRIEPHIEPIITRTI